MTHPIIHLDGTVCNDRKSMPSKADIAFYWRNQAFDTFNYFMDWGEPSCWACGKWYESCPDLEKQGLPVKKVFSYWNKHYYLERCHILPKAHDGCNCPANLTLLCKSCHKASPDTRNLALFATWVKNRASNFELIHEDLKRVQKELDYTIEEFDYRILDSPQFLKFAIKNAIPVGGKIPMSTRYALLIEFKGLMSKDKKLTSAVYEAWDKKLVDFKNSLSV